MDDEATIRRRYEEASVLRVAHVRRVRALEIDHHANRHDGAAGSASDDLLAARRLCPLCG
ncbi:MAG TPA: hypothetical protein VLG28_14175 [Acidimicrobiia bacterium]|nr:hypothetical protein [Acidimicrobiia bacterium]